MTEDDNSDGTNPRDNLRRFPENVRRFPENVQKPLPPMLSGYSKAWQDACREILEIYRQVSRSSRKSQKISYPRLLEKILERYETVDGGPLQYNLFYDWMAQRSTRMREDAFAFIDDFIRRIPYDDPLYKKVVRNVIKRIDDEIMSSLRALYLPKKLNYLDANLSVMEGLLGKSFLSPIFSEKAGIVIPGATPVKFHTCTQVMLHFYRFENGISKVRAIYSKIPFSSIQRYHEL